VRLVFDLCVCRLGCRGRFVEVATAVVHARRVDNHAFGSGVACTRQRAHARVFPRVLLLAPWPLGLSRAAKLSTISYPRPLYARCHVKLIGGRRPYGANKCRQPALQQVPFLRQQATKVNRFSRRGSRLAGFLSHGPPSVFRPKMLLFFCKIKQSSN